LADFSDFGQATSKRNLTQINVVLTTSLQYCRYIILWNTEVVVWPFTTMNSYWIAQALVQKWLTK